MIVYAITSRVLLAAAEPERFRKLVGIARDWAVHGVDFIQIREKDLAPAELTRLATGIVQAVQQSGGPTRVLINAAGLGVSVELAAGIALAAGTDGIHLPDGLTPEALASALSRLHDRWRHRQSAAAAPAEAGAPAEFPIISVSCHSVAGIHAARAAGADLALFAPVFEKLVPGAPPIDGRGLEALSQACRAGRALPSTSLPELPVLALGGVTLENAPLCIAAGAEGIAAIRLFLRSAGEPRPPWLRLQHLHRQ